MTQKHYDMLKEAADLGLSNQRVKDYALNYVKNKKK